MRKPWFIKKMFLFLLGAIIVVNILVKVTLLNHLLLGVSELSAKRQALVEKKKSLLKKKERLAVLKKRISTAENGISTFEKEVLGSKSERLSKIMDEIDKICADLSLERREASYSHRLLPQGVEEVSLVFPVSGNYDDIRRFIYQLERFPYFVVIDRLELANPEGGGVVLNISLSTYFTLQGKRGTDAGAN